jgi:hypothetical protein
MVSRSLGIEDTDLRTMNDLLRAHAQVDVVSGAFSVFAEPRVMNGRVEGYVKPLFRDVRLYGATKTRRSRLVRSSKSERPTSLPRCYATGHGRSPRRSCPSRGLWITPKANTWEALRGLIRNVFDKVILLGVERARLGLKR